MAKALTIKAIEAARAGTDRREIPDGGLPGLYLVVQPSGARSWAVRYRFDRKPRKFTIGSFPAFGLADARRAAGAALRAVSEGRDPADERKAAQSARSDVRNRVDAVLDEFLVRHVDAKNRENTARETKRFIDNELRPTWGDRHIASITRRDVIQLLDRLVDRGAPASANRVHAILRKFFNWTVERDIRDSTPVANIKAPAKTVSRDRVLSDQEIRLLWWACIDVGWPFGTLAQLLLLTGQRREEVAGICRDELSLGKADPRWEIPPSRAKNDKPHTVWLAPQAVKLIASLPTIDGSDLLLTTNGETSISGFSKGKVALDGAMRSLAIADAVERGVNDLDAVSIEPWRLHDLRRTAASGMQALGVAPHIVDATLNHRSGAIKGLARVYLRHDYADERRAALYAWAKRVVAIAGKRPKAVAS